MPKRGCAFALLLVSALVLNPAAAAAQTVLARVLDAETDAPVSGALSYLLDDGGVTVETTLTDDIGRAMFLDVEPGAYRIRVEMIGRETTTSERFDVESGTPEQVEVRLPSSAIALEGIEVSAGERCRIRPEEGLTIARVWDEARKALEAASYTDRSDLYRYRIETWQRDLDRDARVVQRETGSEREGFMRVPFESLPAEDLVEGGFVQEDDDGSMRYYAPDARVLLSDVFLDSHCLRLEEGSEGTEGLVGVAFEPASDRSNRIADIAGTLWLDPETAELRWLEYRYVNVLPGLATDLIGGRVEFRSMPDGTWIVPEWWIRMPVLVQERGLQGRLRTRIDGYRQAGGRVAEVRNSGGDAFLRGESGTIEGFVQDSLGVLPLRGVRVGVVGSNQQVFTDEEGRFRITGLSDGTYRIRFVDTRFEAFGVQPDPIEREVRSGEVTSVFFRMPPLSDLLFEACRAEAPPEGTAVLAGRVTGQEGRRPRAGVSVEVRWEDFRMTPRGSGERRITGSNVEGMATETDSDGFYRLCGVPEGRLLSVSLRRDGDESEADTLRIPELSGAHRHDIEWEP
ncbi:MAG: carboxypeptidase-like regulatory domain-containing protein [Gemmatimonadota bacterium]|nr:carboxypeptidase-like regulatory domain-containing protein [Gemmatimonadota bacterium]